MNPAFEQLIRKIEAKRAASGNTSASGTPTSLQPQTWSCEICHDVGFYTLDVPVEDPNFSKPIPCDCQAEKRAAQHRNRVEALSSLGAYPDKTFETFAAKRPGLSDEQNGQLAAAYEVAARYAENPQGWLLLTGSYGTGKTHLAAAIANYRLRAFGEQALMITIPDLLDHLRAAFGPSSETAYDDLFDRVRQAPLLVLDDLGAESSTAWAQEKLYVLFNHRHARRMPTVITTNQDVDTMDGRIRSRLLDQALTQTVQLSIPDNRSPASAIEQNLYDMSRYYSMTFDRFEDRRGELAEDEQGRMDRLIQTAHEYAEHPAGWLVLAGPPATGKTHLAAAIAHERRHRGEQVIMTTTSELIDYLRATFGMSGEMKFAKRMIELKTTPLLVLDNLVIDDKTTAWVRERLHEILIYRFDQNSPTIITMYTGADVVDARIASRIENKARCTVPMIRFPAYRGGAVPRRAARPKARG